MPLCEHCITANLKRCDLRVQFENEVGLMETRTALKSEDSERVPEMEENALQAKIKELKLQLQITALERVCSEFK